MNKLELTREELTTILQVATGNVKDFVMDSDKFIDEQLKAINYIPCCMELPIYMTCDEDDGQVFAAFTSNERCEIEAEESGTATQVTTLYFGERK